MSLKLRYFNKAALTLFIAANGGLKIDYPGDNDDYK